MRNLGIVFVIILGVLAALWLGGAGMMGYNFGMDPGMMSGVVTSIAPIYLILIVAAGIAMILLLLVRTPRHAAVGADRSANGSAMEISRTRYANGEITKKQFEQIKHDLRA